MEQVKNANRAPWSEERKELSVVGVVMYHDFREYGFPLAQDTLSGPIFPGVLLISTSSQPDDFVDEFIGDFVVWVIKCFYLRDQRCFLLQRVKERAQHADVRETDDDLQQLQGFGSSEFDFDVIGSGENSVPR